MKAYKREMDEGVVLKQLLSYDENDNVEYIGMAHPGSPTNAEEWLLIKIFYDANENIVERSFANGSVNFTGRWSLRQIYEYK